VIQFSRGDRYRLDCVRADAKAKAEASGKRNQLTRRGTDALLFRAQETATAIRGAKEPASVSLYFSLNSRRSFHPGLAGNNGIGWGGRAPGFAPPGVMLDAEAIDSQREEP
jgi:hypothetical protein